MGNRWLYRARRGPWVIYLLLILFIAFNAMFNPPFRSSFNISNLISQSAALMLVSVGQSFAIIGGGFDFSVGGNVSLITCIVATQMKNSLPSMLLVGALVLCAGAGIGAINGIGVTFFRINPFIITIGTMSITQGLAYLLRQYPGGYVPPSYVKAMTGQTAGIPTPVVLMLVAVVTGAILLTRTRFGRYIYAVGGSEESAKAAGISVSGIKIATYMVCALFATIGGLFMAARISSGDPRIGESLPLDSITSVVLGGLIIGGGRGSLIGVVAGVFFIVLLNNALTLFDISPYYHYIIKGILLGLAAALSFRKEEREYL